MDNILKGLSKKQLEFMSIECGVSVEKIKKADENQVLSLYDVVCDIEIDETVKADDSESDELSERGKMAENIVTIIGNNIRDKKGLE